MDYVIVDRTHNFWPGVLPYRNMDSTKGYPTREAAERRMAKVIAHYNARHGSSPGRLSVVERIHPVYKGHQLIQTQTTVRKDRVCGERWYEVIEQLYRIDGTRSKPEGRRPWLTTLADCRKWIDRD